MHWSYEIIARKFIWQLTQSYAKTVCNWYNGTVLYVVHWRYSATSFCCVWVSCGKASFLCRKHWKRTSHEWCRWCSRLRCSTQVELPSFISSRFSFIPLLLLLLLDRRLRCSTWINQVVVDTVFVLLLSLPSVADGTATRSSLASSAEWQCIACVIATALMTYVRTASVNYFDNRLIEAN